MPSSSVTNADKVRLCSVNIQCLRNKVPEIEILCELNGLHILCVVEHWLTVEELSFYSSIAGLNLVASFCRNSLSGGAAIFMSPSLQCSPIDLSDFSEEFHYELAGVMINDYSLVVLAMYRSPNGDLSRFFHLLEQCLRFLVTLNMSVVIGTDHNVDLLRATKDVANLLNILRSYNLYSAVTEPTRGGGCLSGYLFYEYR